LANVDAEQRMQGTLTGNSEAMPLITTTSSPPQSLLMDLHSDR
jgi:hypothetical protein